jgi:hypothetical protein
VSPLTKFVLAINKLHQISVEKSYGTKRAANRRATKWLLRRPLGNSWNDTCSRFFMDSHNVSEPDRNEPPHCAVTRSDRRRKLLLGSVGGSSVLMSILSRPVLGQTTCVAAYVATSVAANASRTTKFATVCNGMTPAQWKMYATEWPSPYCGTALYGSLAPQQATLFHCPTTGLNGRVFGVRTMLEVIDINEGGVGITALVRYIVAALLNARAGRTPVLGESQVRAMWNSVVNLGYYEAAPGVRWSPAQLIAYLQTTMG